jgi:catalase
MKHPMHRNKLWRIAIMSAPFITAAAALATDASAAPPNPVEMVDALNGTFGRHAGARASHAKGQCVVGQFEPSAELRRLSRSPLFDRPVLEAVGRLSVGGGNPGVSDKSRTVRGLALRIGDGTRTYDLVMVSEPVFFAATPESFVSFLQARVPDPATRKPDPEKIAAHNARYPEGKNQPALLAAHAAPASYASTPYFSNNAFKFVDRAGRGTWARLVMEPAAGTQYLDAAAEASLPDNFLIPELTQRLASAAVEFTLVAQQPGPQDSLVDSSRQWSGDGQAPLPLGRLRITGLGDAARCDGVTFVPTLLPEGIEPSDDPILKARAAAYAVSFARRQAK